MLLQTTLIRPGGSRHEIDGVIYHFGPKEGDDRHTAVVTRTAHVKRFLSIDGFTLADDDVADVLTPPDPAPPAATMPVLPQSDTAPIDLSGMASPVLTGAPVTDPEDAGDDEDAEPKPYEAMSLEELQDEFRDMFGRAPHPKAKSAKIIEYLRNPPEQG